LDAPGCSERRCPARAGRVAGTAASRIAVLSLDEVSTVSMQGHAKPADASPVHSVPIVTWPVAVAPAMIRTLLGSCVGVVLYERVAKLGGVAHIVLPVAQDGAGHPGKYANTAIPAMIAELEQHPGASARCRFTAKLVGGASMFQVDAGESKSL